MSRLPTRFSLRGTAVIACLAFLGVPAAHAQFKVTGPAPYTPAVARQKIRTLLEKVDSSNRKQTIDTLTGWLSWYRDILDDEMIAAWKKDTRENLPEVIRPLADSRVAVAIVDFSWREQRQTAFLPAYALMFEDMMIRFADSPKPMLDDLIRAAAAGQPLDLTEPEAETVCRIFLDMPDLGTWRKTALQILPFYRETAQLLLAVDVRGFPGDKRDRAEFWLYDPRSPLRENAAAPEPSSFAVRGRAPAPAPSSQAGARPSLAQAPSSPSLAAAPPSLAATPSLEGAAPAAPAQPYNGPKSGTMHCIGGPIAQNAEYVFEGLPPVKIRVEFDSKNWEAYLSQGAAGQTQTLTLKNVGTRAQKSCTVRWSIDR
jgi:hypothetical protein